MGGGGVGGGLWRAPRLAQRRDPRARHRSALSIRLICLSLSRVGGCWSRCCATTVPQGDGGRGGGLGVVTVEMLCLPPGCLLLSLGGIIGGGGCLMQVGPVPPFSYISRCVVRSFIHSCVLALNGRCVRACVSFSFCLYFVFVS